MTSLKKDFDNKDQNNGQTLAQLGAELQLEGLSDAVKTGEGMDFIKNGDGGFLTEALTVKGNENGFSITFTSSGQTVNPVMSLSFAPTGNGHFEVDHANSNALTTSGYSSPRHASPLMEKVPQFQAFKNKFRAHISPEAPTPSAPSAPGK